MSAASNSYTDLYHYANWGCHGVFAWKPQETFQPTGSGCLTRKHSFRTHLGAPDAGLWPPNFVDSASCDAAYRCTQTRQRGLCSIPVLLFKTVIWRCATHCGEYLWDMLVSLEMAVPVSMCSRSLDLVYILVYVLSISRGTGNLFHAAFLVYIKQLLIA